jgi:hypothetical protein
MFYTGTAFDRPEKYKQQNAFKKGFILLGGMAKGMGRGRGKIHPKGQRGHSSKQL